VLMDVMMPHMDGFQAAAAIRALPDPHQARVPIVILTARDAPDDAERCRAAGLDDYLAKPIDVRQLAQLVGRFPPRPPAAG
jgi:CheY-like chemotaxis protein